MRRIFLVLGCLFSFLISQAQLLDFVEIGNIRASMNYLGVSFQNNGVGFEVPKGGGAHSIYSSNIWIGGISNGTTYFSGGTFFYDEPSHDYRYGPIASNYTSTAFSDKYKRLWKISKAEVRAHADSFNIPGYITPEVILNWPAHGDTLNGESENLAPFIDLNTDGLYQPENGEYPIVRGDEMIYVIINDDTPDRGPGASLGVEIHIMMYAFEFGGLAIDNSMFLNYAVYNRSDNFYNDLYLGNWVDMDLGNPNDDLIGCDTTYSMFYVYNGTDFDSDYGNELPAVGAIYLNNNIGGFLYHNRDSSLTGDPYTSSDFYNYITGRWKDGKPMTYGGTGYQSSAEETRFMFSGDPVSQEGWNEISEGNIPADRRGVGSIGPFSFAPGERICSDISFSWARGFAGQGAAAGVVALRKAANYIRTVYHEFGYSCDPIKVEIADFIVGKDSICPGESLSVVNISETDPINAIWSFPGGIPNSFSGLTPPTVYYPTPGTYDIGVDVAFPSGVIRSKTLPSAIHVSDGVPPTFFPQILVFDDCGLDSIRIDPFIFPESTADLVFVSVNDNPFDTTNGSKTYPGSLFEDGDFIQMDIVAGGDCLYPRDFSTDNFTINLEFVPPTADLEFVDSTLIASPTGPGYRYNWYLDGIVMFGFVTFNEFVPTDSGDYFVEVIWEESGCSKTSDTLVFHGKAVGIFEKYIPEKDGLVFPNPGEEFNLEPEPVALEIFDLLGHKVYQGKTRPSTKYWDEGVYFIRWKDQNGNSYQEKWLKHSF